MKDRLAQFMKSEGLSSSKLAEIMEVPPSNISHLLAGRNKPGFEFISKMLLRFPGLNPDWLINGVGHMCRRTANAVSLPESAPATVDIPAHARAVQPDDRGATPAVQTMPSLFETVDNQSKQMSSLDALQSQPLPEKEPATATLPDISVVAIKTAQKTIRRVILLHDDYTFSTYTSENEVVK